MHIGRVGPLLSSKAVRITLKKAHEHPGGGGLERVLAGRPDVGRTDVQNRGWVIGKLDMVGHEGGGEERGVCVLPSLSLFPFASHVHSPL